LDGLSASSPTKLPVPLEMLISNYEHLRQILSISGATNRREHVKLAPSRLLHRRCSYQNHEHLRRRDRAERMPCRLRPACSAGDAHIENMSISGKLEHLRQSGMPQSHCPGTPGVPV